MDWSRFAEGRSSLNRPLIMAHRGSSALLPENSLDAFQKAIDDGADILETDLHFSKDEALVVIHDETIDRTTEGSGAVRAMTLQELKQFRLKQPPDRAHADARILSLPELIESTAGQIPLALELKDARFAEPYYAERLVRLLDSYGILAQCGVISFDLTRVQAVKQVYPQIAGGWITMNNPSPRHPVEFVGPYWPLMFLNPLYLTIARRLGKLVCPLDPAPEARLGLYLKLKLDVLLTDNPAKTLRAIAAKQSPPLAD